MRSCRTSCCILGTFNLLRLDISNRRIAHYSPSDQKILADFDDAHSVIKLYVYEYPHISEQVFMIELDWQLVKPRSRQEGEAQLAHLATIRVDG